MRRFVLLVIVVLAVPMFPEQAPDPWEPLRFFAGKWKGVAEGQAGHGTVERTYEFVMRGRFLHERNVSTYEPQEKNPEGEVHEHWSLFSYDKGRKALVLRQFHVEGFVNQYALPLAAAGKQGFVFESEAFENLPSGWKAREVYEIRSNDEFIETFELAAPGKPFELYSRNHFRRGE